MQQDNLPRQIGLERSRRSIAANAGFGSAGSAGAWPTSSRFAPRREPRQPESDYPVAILAAIGLEDLLEAAVLEASPEIADSFRGSLMNARNEYSSFFTKLYLSLALGIISEESYNNIDIIMDIACAFREDDNLKKAGFRDNTIKYYCSFLIVPPDVSAYSASCRFAHACNAIATEIASYSRRRQRSAA